MADQALSYALSRTDNGWNWSVLDWNGETVAEGSAAARAEADGAIQAALHSGSQRPGSPLAS